MGADSSGGRRESTKPKKRENVSKPMTFMVAAACEEP
jgi:hypothetical protein